MVGFNRRYSPCLQRIAQLMRGSGPLQMFYRVQAGSLADDAWQWLPEEGGRFVGEAGHFFDVFQFLANAEPASVSATRIHPAQATREHACNISATVAYRDGSVGTLLYTTMGGARLPKEYLEVHGGGSSVLMSNFDELQISLGQKKLATEKGFSGKGQRQQMQAFLAALSGGAAMPVNFETLADVTEVTFDAASCVQGTGFADNG